MKRPVVFSILSIAAILFSINYPENLRLFHVKPDFLLIIAIVANIYFSKKEGKIVASCSGLLKDIFSFGAFGSYLISFTICGYIARRLKSFIYRERFFEQALFVFIISFANILIICLLSLFSARLEAVPQILLKGTAESLFTSLVSPIIINLIKKCAPKYSF